MSRLNFDGRVAVITGAASGIGAALATGLSARGCHLALADIDLAGLESLKAEIARPDRQVLIAQVDVASAEDIARFHRDVETSFDAVHLLFNNAGVAVGGDFEATAPEDFDWLMAINFGGVVAMTRAFLPNLKQADQSHVVNISSLFGIIAPAGQTAYSASKFAVRGFSNALRHELSGTPVSVSTVHPGGVATEIARKARLPDSITDADRDGLRARSDALLSMPPRRAAEIILNGVQRKAPRILVGRDAHMAAWLERIFPVAYWKIIQRRMGQV